MYEVTTDKVENAFIQVEKCHLTDIQSQGHDQKAQEDGMVSEQGQRQLWTSSLERI